MRNSCRRFQSVVVAWAFTAGVVFGQCDLREGEVAEFNELLWANRFDLVNGYQSQAQIERPFVSGGMVVVLRVGANLSVARDSTSPQLFAGYSAAELFPSNRGDGIVVAIIGGAESIDGLLVWLGPSDLPEHVYSEKIVASRLIAESTGIQPISSEIAGGVTEPTSTQYESRLELLHDIRRLFERFGGNGD